MLPAAEYAPDLPDGAGSTKAIWNVYPRTPVSYGPINTPMPQYDALPGRCQGGCAYKDNEGNIFIFAATANDLFMLKKGLANWEKVSKVDGGYNAGEEMWQFAYFNGAIIATQIGDPPQRFILGSDTNFTDLPGNPPRARSVAVIKNNFLVFGNTWDPINGFKRQRIWWSGAGDATSWPLLGTTDAAIAQSGAVDLLGPGGDVQGIAADLTAADAAVFQEYAVRAMQYSGPPSTFSFRSVQAARGAMCPHSIVVNGGVAYYWGQDGVCAFDGAQSVAIGANKIDKTTYREFNGNFLKRVVGASDPLSKLLWWSYPSLSSPSGDPDRSLIYNWDLNRFSLAGISCEVALKLLSIGYTLDELWTVLGYQLDEVPAPLDSPIWQGGRLALGIFGLDHRIAFLTGETLVATVETAELQPPPGRRWLVTNSRPIVDGIGTAPTVAIGRRETQQQAVAYTSPVSINSLGQCPVRTSGRYLRAKTIVPAGFQSWDNFSGIELDLVQQGRR